MKVLLTGGGTAGHIYPIVAIAEELIKYREHRILYVGSRQGQEVAIAKRYNLPFKGLIVGKWRPYISISNIWDLFKTFVGIIQAFFILQTFRPDVIFAKGGYVTFPILIWVRLLKIPIVIHESDAVMGRANQWAADFAQKICVAFPAQYYKENSSKLVFTGIPIRKEFYSQAPAPLQNKNILVAGGSQGAHRINEILDEALDELLQKYQVYHLCGPKELKIYQKGKFIANKNYHLEGYNDDMVKLMAKADLIISRAGATTFAEIGALSKPAILIPYPAAAADHQSVNAKIYKEAGAAIVIAEKDLTAEGLISIINQTMADTSLRQSLGQNAQQFGQKNSTEKIINVLEESYKGKNAREN